MARIRRTVGIVAAVVAALSAGAVGVVAAQSSSAVVGGVQVQAGQLPYTVSLSNNCGATLVAPDLVLSASHCFRSGYRHVTVRVGSVNRSYGGQLRRIAKLVRGPGAQQGDWALLKLSSPVTGVPTVAIAANPEYSRQNRFIAAGWGYQNEGRSTMASVLRAVAVPLVPDGTRGCTEAPDKEICAGDVVNGGIDTCVGDSGGPLLASVNASDAARIQASSPNTSTALVQVGIVSWGRGCARAGEAGHYAEVSAVIDRIKAAATDMGSTGLVIL